MSPAVKKIKKKSPAKRGVKRKAKRKEDVAHLIQLLQKEKKEKQEVANKLSVVVNELSLLRDKLGKLHNKTGSVIKHIDTVFDCEAITSLKKTRKSRKGASTGRGLRNVYDAGEGFAIRSSEEARTHQSTVLYDDIDEEIVDGSTPKKRRKQNSKKCIVCCMCIKSRDYHYRMNKAGKKKNKSREGYRVGTVCVQCPEAARKLLGAGMATDEKLYEPVYLCTEDRFGIGKTCFEIHHSGDPYPKLECVKVAKDLLSPGKKNKPVEETNPGSDQEDQVQEQDPDAQQAEQEDQSLQ